MHTRQYIRPRPYDPLLSQTTHQQDTERFTLHFTNIGSFRRSGLRQGTSERGNPFFSSSTCSFVYQSINQFHTCQCWQVVEWTKRSLVLRSGLNPIPCTIGNPATRTHRTELSQGTITRKSGEQLINRTVVKSEISSIRSLHKYTQHGMGRVLTNDIDYTTSHTLRYLSTPHRT